MHPDDLDLIFKAIGEAKKAYEKSLEGEFSYPPPITITVRPLVYHEDEDTYGEVVDSTIMVEDAIPPLTRKETKP